MTETPFTRMLPLARSTAQALLPYLTKPFAFFGHSMGAIIGFEIARYLRKEHGLTPIHLFVSGRRAPQISIDSPFTYDLGESDFLEELKKLNGTPKEVFQHHELLRLMLPILRADFESVQTYDYRPEHPLDCPISVFGGLEDLEVSYDYLSAWREHTTSSFEVCMFPGDHFFLNSSQALLLQVLSCELNRLVSVLNGKCH